MPSNKSPSAIVQPGPGRLPQDTVPANALIGNPDENVQFLTPEERLKSIIMSERMFGDVVLPASSHDSAVGMTFSLGPNSGGNPPFTGSWTDFTLEGGYAFVGGVLVTPPPGDGGAPASSVTYESDLNILGAGTVDSFSAGVLVDASQNWRDYHDLVPTVDHTGCRVKFTSGAENGNEYTITAFTFNSLTISGGTPAPGDSYIVKPPAIPSLASPTFAFRVYLQVFWEDVERWVVRTVMRATGDGTTSTPSAPTTPSVEDFGPRYLDLGTVTHSVVEGLTQNSITTRRLSYQRFYDDFIAFTGSQIPGAQIDISDFTSVSQQNYNDTSNFWGGYVDIGGWPLTLQTVLNRFSSALLRMQNFASVSQNRLTSDATVPDLQGSFFYKSGAVSQEVELSDLNEDVYVFGESRANSVFDGPSSTIVNIRRGEWKRLTFQDVNTSSINNHFRFGWDGASGSTTGGFVLSECSLPLQTARFYTPENATSFITNCRFDTDRQNVNGGFDPGVIFRPEMANGTIIVQGCHFNGTPQTAMIDLEPGTTQTNNVIIFRDCSFISGSTAPLLQGPGVTVIDPDNIVKVVFENCHMERTVSSPEYLIDLEDQSLIDVTIRNCQMYTIGGKAIRVTNTPCVFEDIFVSISGPADAGLVATDTMINISGYSSEDGRPKNGRITRMKVVTDVVPTVMSNQLIYLSSVVADDFTFEMIGVGPANCGILSTSSSDKVLWRNLKFSWDTAPTFAYSGSNYSLINFDTNIIVDGLSIITTNSSVVGEDRYIFNGGTIRNAVLSHQSGDASTEPWQWLCRSTTLEGFSMVSGGGSGFRTAFRLFHDCSIRDSFLTDAVVASRGSAMAGLDAGPSSTKRGNFVENCAIDWDTTKGDCLDAANTFSMGICTINGNFFNEISGGNITNNFVRHVFGGATRGSVHVTGNTFQGDSDGATNWVLAADTNCIITENRFHSTNGVTTNILGGVGTEDNNVITS